MIFHSMEGRTPKSVRAWAGDSARTRPSASPFAELYTAVSEFSEQFWHRINKSSSHYSSPIFSQLCQRQAQVRRSHLELTGGCFQQCWAASSDLKTGMPRTPVPTVGLWSAQPRWHCLQLFATHRLYEEPNYSLQFLTTFVYALPFSLCSHS